MFEIVAVLHTSFLCALYSFSACCMCLCVCVCKPLFVLSVGHGLKALAFRVPRRIVEFKRERKPISLAARSTA
jgi:hypothetical protein